MAVAAQGRPGEGKGFCKKRDTDVEYLNIEKMKRVILLLCLLSGLGAAGKESGGGAGAKVDPRVELLGVVFRLAGASEYSSTYAKQYVEDIEAWFAPYREDTLVRYVKRIRSQYYVGYNINSFILN